MFSKIVFGLDISDHTIELVELKKSWRKIRVANKYRAVLEAGMVKNGKIKEQEKFFNFLKLFFKETNINNKPVVFGLPESQVFLHIFQIDKINEKQSQRLARQEAIKNIPLLGEDMLFSHSILFEKNGAMNILIAAASHQTLSEWKLLFHKLNLKVSVFDIETLALARVLLPFAANEEEKKNRAILDIGAKTTNIAIYNKQNKIELSHTLNFAGNDLTRKIQSILQSDWNEAENIKFACGNQREDVKRAIGDFIQELGNAIQKTFIYYNQTSNKQVQEAILVGGTAKLNGIVEMLGSQLQIPTMLGKNSLADSSESFEYLEAVGLALKLVNNREEDICFLAKNI